jgi:hypothetical protein
VRRAHKSGISQSTPTTAYCNHLLAVFDEVGDHDTGLIHHQCAGRDSEHQIVAFLAVADVAFAVCSVGRGVMRVALVTEKGGDRRIGSQCDRTTGSPIASSGLPFGATLDSFKGGDPSSPVASPKTDTDPVNEHDRMGC